MKILKDLAYGLSKIIELEKTKGQIFEFGGPDILSMKEIYKLIMDTLHVKRILLPLPLFIAFEMGFIMQPFEPFH